MVANATTTLSGFLRRLTHEMAAETLRDLSDQQLVEKALASCDEVVFQAIVGRHGTMVYGVCWRVLQHEHDAEDAFQATFLVLARNLRTVRKRASLASWLHGVARRIALKAQAQAAAHRRHERQASKPEAVPADDASPREARAVLDVELAQLPEKWRLPLILCYLEGRTQDEAAGQLGVSKGTLRNRLDEARNALASRLTQRGVVWPAVLSAVLLSDCIALAAPAPGLFASTIEAAAGVAAGKTVATAASAKVAALTEGVLKTMFLTKLKTGAAVLLVLGVLGLTAASAGVLYRSVAGQSGREQDQDAQVTQSLKIQKTAEPSARSGEKVAKAPTPSVEVVTQYLRKKYPEQGDGTDGRLRLAPGTKVTEVDNPLLKKHLPQTRFFLTKLDTDFWDYLHVPLLVSASVADGKVIFRESFSPVFRDVPGEFLAQFRGLQAATADDRKAVGEAIGSLLQIITERGDLRNGDFSRPQCRSELWHNGHGWRDIHFEFDRDGRLQSVSLSIHWDE